MSTCKVGEDTPCDGCGESGSGFFVQRGPIWLCGTCDAALSSHYVEPRDKEWIMACIDVLGMSSGLMCPTGPEGIRAMIDSVKAESR